MRKEGQAMCDNIMIIKQQQDTILNLRTEIKTYKFLVTLFTLGYMVMTAGFILAIGIIA